MDEDHYDPELDRYDELTSYYDLYEPDVPADEEWERLSAEAEAVTPVEMAIWEVATQPLLKISGSANAPGSGNPPGH